MKHNSPKARPEPPPLVPRSVAGWLLPLAKAALAAIVLALGCAAHALLRQGQQLGDSLAR